MSHLRRLVGDFHRAIGVQRLSALNRHEQMALTALRAELLSEEGRELRQADEAHRRAPTEETLRALAKELGDLLYVAVGTADVLATPLVDPDQSRALPIPAFFAEGNVVQATRAVIGSLDTIIHQVDMVYDAQDIAEQIEDAGSDVQELVVQLYAMAAAYRLPLDQIFAAVHASNLSKISIRGEVIRRADGKVLKGAGYQPAELDFLRHAAA